jgi:hypothetical protein
MKRERTATKEEGVILLLGSAADTLLGAVRRELGVRNRSVLVVDETDLLSRARFTFIRRGLETTGSIQIDDRIISTDKISGVLLRLGRTWWPDRSFDLQDQMFVFHETIAAWFNFLSYLRCPVVNQFSLGWWLHDLNYPLDLARSLCDAMEIPLARLPPSLPYEIRLNATEPGSSPTGGSIYIAGNEIISRHAKTQAVIASLQEKHDTLNEWLRHHQLSVCRLDFQLEAQPAVSRVEAYPLFDGERESVLHNVAAGIADHFR